VDYSRFLLSGGLPLGFSPLISLVLIHGHNKHRGSNNNGTPYEGFLNHNEEQDAEIT
jgi:hypothetical protein